VYFHETTRAAEVMMEKLLRRAQACQAYLPGFVALNRLLEESLPATPEGVEGYLDLDDGMLWTAMHLWSLHDDPVLRDFSSRLLNRRIFRSVQVQSAEQQAELVARLKRRADDAGCPTDYYVICDSTVNQAYKDDYIASGSGDAEPTDCVYLFDREGVPHELAEVSFLVQAVRSHRVQARRVLCPEEWTHGES